MTSHNKSDNSCMIYHKTILKGFSKFYLPHPTEGLQCKRKYPTF